MNLKLSNFLFLFVLLAFDVQSQQRSDEPKDFAETVAILRKRGWIGEDEHPQKPKSMPKYSDDGPLGISFFSTIVEEEDFSWLDLERTYFNGSEVNGATFHNTRLKESNLCWNDFYHTDFSYADLSHSDLRSSIFENVRFVGTNLSGSDLRRSSFENCDFTAAQMRGVKLTREQGKVLQLSQKQIKEINWQESDGEEPEGG